METKTVTLTEDDWMAILLSLFWERHAETGKPIPENDVIIEKIQEQTGYYGICG